MTKQLIRAIYIIFSKLNKTKLIQIISWKLQLMKVHDIITYLMLME